MLKKMFTNLVIKIIKNQRDYMDKTKYHVGISGTSVWVDHDEVMKKVREDMKIIKEIMK